MFKVDNSEMLSYLRNDVIKNYYTCDNIVNAGAIGYGISKVHFYSRYEDNFDEYASFIVNWCNDLIVDINSEDMTFFGEICDETKNIFNDYNEVSFATPYIGLIDSEKFSSLFSVVDNVRENRVFAMYSENELKRLVPSENVNIKMYHRYEAVEFESYNNDDWQGLDNMIKYGKDSDILFIIRKGDVVCGYLDANNTSDNIYDIANIFVAPKYRGQKLGTMLAGEYAYYCFENGFIPHYGTAVTKYSESVALNCGFSETSRTCYIKIGLK